MKTARVIIITCVCGLVALGLVMLYSSSMAQKGAHFLLQQAVAGLVGAACCFAAALIDYRVLKKLALPIFAVTVAALALVLVPSIGEWRNGARRWFDLGPIHFQPSELAKISIIIFLAWYGHTYARHRGEFIRGLVVPGSIVGIALCLIFIEPDRGTTILMLAVTTAMLLMAGAKLWKALIPGLPLLAFIAWSLYKDPMRLKRILVWLSPEEHKADVGYQAWQSMVALGAGGIPGLGLGNGRQKLGFVPEHHTDFIFSVIGEELGLIATLSILVVFLVLLMAGISVAYKSKDTFGFLLAAGITFLIGFQAFINIGVVSNALPNKGLPLPFISYGGSSLVLMLGCIGILLSVARHTDDTVIEEEDEHDSADLPALQRA